MAKISMGVSSIPLRDTYISVLQQMMLDDIRVMHLDADMQTAIGSYQLEDEFPDRIVNVGVQEANMIGIACGLSVNGMIPFVHSFGVFTTRRCADQVYMSGCYNNANVKILGSDPGVCAEHNGGTHMPLDDMSLMRAFTGMKVFDIADTVLLREILPLIKDDYGMAYLRLPRKDSIDYYAPDNTFEIGKGVLLREGHDITIIASGIEVPRALEAAAVLEAKGVSCDVIDMFTVKPIDAELIVQRASITGAVVTAENHSIIGGLGSAVAEVLSEQRPVWLERVGVKDRFGEVGTAEYLSTIFGITTADIVCACNRLLAKKNQ